ALLMRRDRGGNEVNGFQLESRIGERGLGDRYMPAMHGIKGTSVEGKIRTHATFANATVRCSSWDRPPRNGVRLRLGFQSANRRYYQAQDAACAARARSWARTHMERWSCVLFPRLHRRPVSAPADEPPWSSGNRNSLCHDHRIQGAML